MAGFMSSRNGIGMQTDHKNICGVSSPTLATGPRAPRTDLQDGLATAGSVAYINFGADPELVRLKEAVQVWSTRFEKGRVLIERERKTTAEYSPFSDDEPSPLFKQWMEAQEGLKSAREELERYERDQQRSGSYVARDGEARF